MKNFSDQAKQIIESRYLARDEQHNIIENIERMFRRVATTLGEDKADELYEAMISKKFTPAGRTLANAGGPTKLVNSCIVLEFEDSMDGIFQVLKEASLLQQQGSGLGFAWHLLRPAGTKAKTNRGIASGPVSFLKVYNQAFSVIKQQNRHGANMGVMSVDHPDILEFIHCKEKEGELQTFNISIGLTDRFMKAVVEDDQTPWICEFPCNRSPDFIGEVTRTYPRRIKRDGREVPTKITPVKITARQLFEEIVDAAWDNGEPGTIFLDTINNANPLPGLGRLNATNPCVVGETIIETTQGQKQIKDMVGKEFDVYCMEDGKLVIKKASNIQKTGTNLPIMEVVTQREKIRLTPNHKLYIKNRGWVETQNTQKEDVIIGLQRIKKSEKYLRVKLSTEKEHRPEHRFIMSYYEDINDKDVHHKDDNTFNNTIENLEALQHSEHSTRTNNGHNDWCERDSKGMFLRKKQKKKKQSISWKNPWKGGLTIKTVKPCGNADVYNMTVEKVHNYIANGFVIKNCGEQALGDGDVCNLGSINLGVFVKNGKIEWEELEKTANLAIMALDNVIDRTSHAITRVNNMCVGNRRIGLGVMGWADMLVKMKTPYDSKEALVLAEQVMGNINRWAFDTSIKRAEKYGAFPNIDKSIYKTPIRNAARTSIAPTGTISMMFDCNSGIEPHFALAYKKTVMNGTVFNYINEDLMKVLKKQGIYTPELEEKIVVSGTIQKIPEIPQDIKDVFKTAMDISAEDHIRMQAAFQTHTDNSISKTINFPNKATKEDVMSGYLLAWKLGCRGCTVYRDGSRDIQVLETNNCKNGVCDI